MQGEQGVQVKHPTKDWVQILPWMNVIPPLPTAPSLPAWGVGQMISVELLHRETGCCWRVPQAQGALWASSGFLFLPDGGSPVPSLLPSRKAIEPDGQWRTRACGHSSFYSSPALGAGRGEHGASLGAIHSPQTFSEH